MSDEKGKAYGHRNSESNYFPTPYSITEALMEREVFNWSNTVLEPAAGKGDMVKVLEQHFWNVKCYDIEPMSPGIPAGDFYKETEMHDYIITNPPYGKELDKFVIKCQQITKKKFALFTRINFLSGSTRFNSDLYKHLKNVYVFTRMPDLRSAIRSDGKYQTGMNVYAWLVWDMKYKKKPMISWIDNSEFVLRKGDL